MYGQSSPSPKTLLSARPKRVTTNASISTLLAAKPKDILEQRTPCLADAQQTYVGDPTEQYEACHRDVSAYGGKFVLHTRPKSRTTGVQGNGGYVVLVQGPYLRQEML